MRRVWKVLQNPVRIGEMKKYYVISTLWVLLAVCHTIVSAANLYHGNTLNVVVGAGFATVSCMMGIHNMNIIHLVNLMDLVDEDDQNG